MAEYTPYPLLEERREHRMPLLSIPEYMRNGITGLPDDEALGLITEDAVRRIPGNFAEIDIDLDGLDEHNTLYGHRDGNEYLRTTGDVLTHALRTDDVVGVVAHPHGDEFRIIVSGVSEQSKLDSIMGRLQNTLEEYGIPASLGGRPHIPGETAEQLAVAADNLMYINKLDRKRHDYSEAQLTAARAILEQATKNGIKIRDLKYLVTILKQDGNKDS